MKKIKDIVVHSRRQIKDVLSGNAQPHQVKADETRKRINCSFNQEEYSRIIQNAGMTGLTPSAYVKQAALAYMSFSWILPASVEQKLGDLVFLTGNMANNINQIARKANMEDHATVDDMVKEKQKVHELEKAVEIFIRNPSQQ